jgi:predicted metal-dependent hydrolase
VAKRKVKEIENFIKYGDDTINYKLLLSKRKTFSLEVHPDRSVKVRAPYRTSHNTAKKWINSRAGWIIEKQNHFSKLIPEPLEHKYENDEIFRFLGTEYKLKLIKDIASKTFIENNYLVVSMPIIKKSKVKSLLEKWYRLEAEKVFLQRMDCCKELVSEIDIKFSGEIKFRKMKRRWGSCSSKGKITLSYELIKADIECIDYVIVHELCHLKEFNHSPAFYNLMSLVMPDWKIRKTRLNSMVIGNYSE